MILVTHEMEFPPWKLLYLVSLPSQQLLELLDLFPLHQWPWRSVFRYWQVWDHQQNIRMSQRGEQKTMSRKLRQPQFQEPEHPLKSDQICKSEVWLIPCPLQQRTWVLSLSLPSTPIKPADSGQIWHISPLTLFTRVNTNEGREGWQAPRRQLLTGQEPRHVMPPRKRHSKTVGYFPHQIPVHLHLAWRSPLLYIIHIRFFRAAPAA